MKKLPPAIRNFELGGKVQNLFRVSMLLLLSCAAGWAQSTAQIHGTVQDTTGAAVPGAEVKATQTATGVVRTVVTGQDGGYVLTNLPLGPYQLEVSKEGFNKSVQSGILLQVNSDPAVDVSLRVGAVSEQVQVEANAALVETRNSGVGEVIQNQRILELPLNGRNVTDLITLAGAAVNYETVQTRWFNNLPEISIGGQSYFGTDYSLDGASHLNFLSGTTMPIAFPDAIQEFKAESSGQSSQHGSATSVSVVTKSGTNEIHGDLFEFLRNDGFGSAREYFSTSTSSLKRNQFGGTIGGPILKNKLFYFGGFQGTITRQNPGNSTSTVPTAAVLAGDWSTFASPTCNSGVQKTLKGGTINNLTNSAATFTNNQIDPAVYTSQSRFIVNKLLGSLQQAGITPDKCGHVTYNTPADESDYQYTGKVDYQLSDKQSLFFRVLETEENLPNALSITPNLLTTNTNGWRQLASSLALGDTYLISSNMVNAFRVGVNRTASSSQPNIFFSYCDAGVNIWCGANPGVAGPLSITGGFSSGEGTPNDDWKATHYSLSDEISLVRGAHQMDFGVGAAQGRLNEFNHFYSVGQPTFNGSITGLGMADFLLGDMSQFYQGLPNTHTSNQNFVNLYFTDTWKINSHLTFNFGIRWEPFLPQKDYQVSNFDMGCFLAGTTSTVFKNAPAGFYFPGDPGFPDDSGVNSHWLHFDPRGGIAWDPKGDGKTSIRAAYAFGYAYVPGIQHEDASGSNPWGGRTILTNPVGGLANPFQSFAGVIHSPTCKCKCSLYALGTLSDQSLRPCYPNHLFVERRYPETDRNELDPFGHLSRKPCPAPLRQRADQLFPNCSRPDRDHRLRGHCHQLQRRRQHQRAFRAQSVESRGGQIRGRHGSMGSGGESKLEWPAAFSPKRLSRGVSMSGELDPVALHRTFSGNALQSQRDRHRSEQSVFRSR